MIYYTYEYMGHFELGSNDSCIFLCLKKEGGARYGTGYCKNPFRNFIETGRRLDEVRRAFW